ncbi:MAG: hypothetical protein R3279_08560, partial [Putridiphycobacter sp.]|nr:hypothetical protein [Putridiphycobacter sp.]
MSLIILVSLYSCQDDKPISIEYYKSSTFSTGYLSYRRSFYFHSGEKYFVTADYVTRKEIIFQNIANSNQIKVSLNAIDALGEQVACHDIVHFDTIVCLTMSNNRLFFLDRNGNIWKEIKLNEEIDALKEFDVFQLDGSSMIRNNCFMYGVEPLVDAGEDMFDYYRIKFNSPYLVVLDSIYQDSVVGRLAVENFYGNFTDSTKFTTEHLYTRTIDSCLYIFSQYDDNIYQYNLESLKLNKIIKIESIHTTIGATPLWVADVKQNPAIFKNRFDNSGLIVDMVFHPQKRLFFVSV